MPCSGVVFVSAHKTYLEQIIKVNLKVNSRLRNISLLEDLINLTFKIYPFFVPFWSITF